MCYPTTGLDSPSAAAVIRVRGGSGLNCRWGAEARGRGRCKGREQRAARTEAGGIGTSRDNDRGRGRGNPGSPPPPRSLSFARPITPPPGQSGHRGKKRNSGNLVTPFFVPRLVCSSLGPEMGCARRLAVVCCVIPHYKATVKCPGVPTLGKWRPTHPPPRPSCTPRPSRRPNPQHKPGLSYMNFWVPRPPPPPPRGPSGAQDDATQPAGMRVIQICAHEMGLPFLAPYSKCHSFPEDNVCGFGWVGGLALGGPRVRQNNSLPPAFPTPK